MMRLLAAPGNVTTAFYIAIFKRTTGFIFQNGVIGFFIVSNALYSYNVIHHVSVDVVSVSKGCLYCDGPAAITS